MKQERKRLLILTAILLAAAFFWLYDRQTHKPREPKVRQLTVESIEDAMTSPAATRMAPPGKPHSVSEIIETVREWGRDPFQPPEGVELFKKDTADVGGHIPHAEETVQNVTGIFIKGSLKIATFGDVSCKEGDMVGGEKVAEILPDRVILKRWHTKRELLLEDEGISVVKKVK